MYKYSYYYRSPIYKKSKKSYPNGILLITDSKKYFDRYTVYYEPYENDDQLIFHYVSMSEYPYSPQGFGQHGELDFRYHMKSHDRMIDFNNLN